MKRWKPGDPIATGAFELHPKDAEAYHQQCAEAREHAIAVHLTKIPRDKAKELLSGIGKRHGAEYRQHLIDKVMMMRAAQ